MPVEIKYKEPTDRPIERIVYNGKQALSVIKSAGGVVFEAAGYTEQLVFMPKADFKEFAAAVYQFSQEI